MQNKTASIWTVPIQVYCTMSTRRTGNLAKGWSTWEHPPNYIRIQYIPTWRGVNYVLNPPFCISLPTTKIPNLLVCGICNATRKYWNWSVSLPERTQRTIFQFLFTQSSLWTCISKHTAKDIHKLGTGYPTPHQPGPKHPAAAWRYISCLRSLDPTEGAASTQLTMIETNISPHGTRLQIFWVNI